MSLYLSIDLGTTGCRSFLFDKNLEILSFDYEEYGLITPKENWTEQKAELWWELTLKTAENAILKAGVSAKEIKSISVSSQGITLVPVDKEINPIYNALSWLDIRAEEETRQIEKDFSHDEVFEITGKPINAAYTLPKILWLKNNEPDVYKNAYKFLMPMDFLIAKLTGVAITDYSMASGTLMYDLKNQCWSEKILKKYGIDEDKLPTVGCAGDFAGKVLPEVAKKLDLNEDCTVAIGAQDQKCAAYGVGLGDGIMTVSLGTSSAVTKYWREAKTHINNGVGWCGYVEKDGFVTEGVISTAATCLRWVRDMFFKDEDYDIINKEAKEALMVGSSLLFYPYLSGPSTPDFYPESEGTFYGIKLATKRGNFALSVMEGIAFQLRIILEAMEAYGSVHTLILFGGGANSSLWCQIIADVTGMKVKVPKTTEAAAAGAAKLAAKAVGEASLTVDCDKEYTPSALKDMYDEKYKKYRKIEKSLWA